MTTFNSQKPYWILLIAVIGTTSMWMYASRVLIPYQKRDAGAHERPRGNLSDLYPRWLGARELILRGRDPYGAEVTREIQIGYYGRALDPSRPGEPIDEMRFAYPVYVVFVLAPTIDLPFSTVQRSFYWVLLFLICGTTILWIRVLRWEASFLVCLSLVVLTLGTPAVMQGLKLQQMSLLVAGFVALGIACLVRGFYVPAGIVLALSTIKPQLVVLLLFYLAVWCVADWRRRYRLAISFLATMSVLVAASEWYLPYWIPEFWRAIHEYQRYTGAQSVMAAFVGSPWSRILEFLALAAMIGICWRERRRPANNSIFAPTVGLILATTVLVIPTVANYNQVFLIPALLVVARDWRAMWERSLTNRFFVACTAGLIVWPWIASVALVALSYILPQQKVEQGWAIPFWTAIQIPIAVTALMLIHYYQQTFPAQTKAGAS